MGVTFLTIQLLVNRLTLDKLITERNGKIIINNRVSDEQQSFSVFNSSLIYLYKIQQKLI